MLYKRPGSRNWYVKLKHRGRTIQKSTGTTVRRDAEKYQAELRKTLQSLRKQSGHTFSDAALRWLDEKQHKKSLDTDLMILDWFRPHLETLYLSEITRDKVEELRQLRRKDSSTETVNRYMALLRSILRIARDDWEWVEKIPKVPMYPKKTRPPRFLTWQQFESLATELPPHLSGPAWFAVLTGLRTAPIQQLQWDWISRDGVRFPPEVMKNSEWLTIPLSIDTWNVLAERLLRSSLKGGASSKMVFVTHAGNAWSEKFTTRAWHKACDRAGLSGVVFHDLRHTWASWQAQRGVPMDVTQKLGGWSTQEAMEIYRHHSTESLSRLSEWVQ